MEEHEGSLLFFPSRGQQRLEQERWVLDVVVITAIVHFFVMCGGAVLLFARFCGSLSAALTPVERCCRGTR